MAHPNAHYQSSSRGSYRDLTFDTDITLVDEIVPTSPWDAELTEDVTLDGPPVFDTLDTDFDEVTFTDRINGLESTPMLTSARIESRTSAARLRALTGDPTRNPEHNPLGRHSGHHKPTRQAVRPPARQPARQPVRTSQTVPTPAPPRRRPTGVNRQVARPERPVRRRSTSRSEWTRDAREARESLASRRDQREALARVIAMAKPRDAANTRPAPRPRPRLQRRQRSES